MTSKNQGGTRAESSKKAKLLITLQRSPDFFENMRKFSEIKEENERLAQKNAAANGEADAKAEEKKWASSLNYWSGSKEYSSGENPKDSF